MSSENKRSIKILWVKKKLTSTKKFSNAKTLVLGFWYIFLNLKYSTKFKITVANVTIPAK